MGNNRTEDTDQACTTYLSYPNQPVQNEQKYTMQYQECTIESSPGLPPKSACAKDRSDSRWISDRQMEGTISIPVTRNTEMKKKQRTLIENTLIIQLRQTLVG